MLGNRSIYEPQFLMQEKIPVNLMIVLVNICRSNMYGLETKMHIRGQNCELNAGPLMHTVVLGKNHYTACFPRWLNEGNEKWRKISMLCGFWLTIQSKFSQFQFLNHFGLWHLMYIPLNCKGYLVTTAFFSFSFPWSHCTEISPLEMSLADLSDYMWSMRH